MIQRILVRHGVSRDLGDLLMGDLRCCIDYFEKNPVGTPLTEEVDRGGCRGLSALMVSLMPFF